MIKAIETTYNGITFRSRLEARWAVFFDELGIEWEYEPEGFEMTGGTRYLPDFWLPTFSDGIWCEVKHRKGDFSKTIQFAIESKQYIWVCEGVPDFAIYKVIQGESMYCVIPNWDQARGENRFFWMPCGLFPCPNCQATEPFNQYSLKDILPIRCAEQDFTVHDSGHLIRAIKTAQNARFEQWAIK